MAIRHSTGGGGGGDGLGLLVSHVYNPGTQDAWATASGTFADVDATNAAISFSVPLNGNYIIRVTAMIWTASGTVMGWNLRDSGGDISGTDRRASSSNVRMPVSVAWKFTGQTAGEARTWKLGQARAAGSSDCQTQAGGSGGNNAGPLVIEVWEAEDTA